MGSPKLQKDPYFHDKFGDGDPYIHGKYGDGVPIFTGSPNSYDTGPRTCEINNYLATPRRHAYTCAHVFIIIIHSVTMEPLIKVLNRDLLLNEV